MGSADERAKEEAAEAPPRRCPTAKQAKEAEAKFTEGIELVKSCGESCVKSVEGGGRRWRGLALLHEAALAGHREAGARYGDTAFGDLMTTGENPEREPGYVDAIAFLRVTALREKPGTESHIPNLKTVKLREDGTFEPPLEPPLSYIPERWVRQGIVEGDRLFACDSK